MSHDRRTPALEIEHGSPRPLPSCITSQPLTTATESHHLHNATCTLKPDHPLNFALFFFFSFLLLSHTLFLPCPAPTPLLPNLPQTTCWVREVGKRAQRGGGGRAGQNPARVCVYLFALDEQSNVVAQIACRCAATALRAAGRGSEALSGSRPPFTSTGSMPAPACRGRSRVSRRCRLRVDVAATPCSWATSTRWLDALDAASLSPAANIDLAEKVQGALAVIGRSVRLCEPRSRRGERTTARAIPQRQSPSHQRDSAPGTRRPARSSAAGTRLP